MVRKALLRGTIDALDNLDKLDGAGGSQPPLNPLPREGLENKRILTDIPKSTHN